MEDSDIVDAVVDLLDSDDAVAAETEQLILAALWGDDELETALTSAAPDNATATGDAVEGAPPVFLRSVSVTGFRGIGPRVSLDLSPGPGLTLVTGRNGSGKSSLVEALEVLLTGSSLRWASRTRVWQQGWRNLHHDAATVIDAEFVTDDPDGGLRLRQRWEPGSDLEDTTTEATLADGTTMAVSELAWARALETYRPLLTYNEIGGLLEQSPSKMYDALASILGLDELAAAQERLRQRRLTADKEFKALQSARNKLALVLREEQGSDERIDLAHALVTAAGDLDSDGLAELAAGDLDPSGLDSLLTRLGGLVAPSASEAASAATGLRDAQQALDDMAGTDAGRAAQTATILDQALQLHATHDLDDCPVCGTTAVLDSDWADTAEALRDALRQQAHAADQAASVADTVERAARRLIGTTPAVLDTAEHDPDGLDLVTLRHRWEQWCTPPGPGQLRELADHLEAQIGPLSSACTRVAAAATERRDTLAATWQPIAVALGSLVTQAQQLSSSARRRDDLAVAEDWVKDTFGHLRAVRFAPIAARAQELWDLLSEHSSVTLAGIDLTGSTTQRRINLDVSIDDQDATALSVMSQGELHALALALFLPRATLPASPFGFVIIDDPVQAMDPARVDGLARVFASIAEQRQVVVFTHDDRLPEAVRRLNLDATVLEVTRRERSTVKIRPVSSPADQSIADARAIASDPGLPATVAATAVAGLCRHAIEARSADIIRQRRISRGEPHGHVADLLAATPKLLPRLAVALLDDPAKGGDVYTSLNRKFGPQTTDAVRACNEGAHGAVSGLRPHELIDRVETLLTGLKP